MSLRIDTVEYYSGSLVIGNTGLGYLGQDIPTIGDSGASFLYNDLTLPADNTVEIRGELLSLPSAGTLFAYEDGSFEFSGAVDGRYSFNYKLWRDGVDSGTYAVTLTVGSIAGSGSGLIGILSIVPGSGVGTGTGYAEISGTGAGISGALNILPANAIAYTGTLTLTEADINMIIHRLLTDSRFLTIAKFLALK